MATLPPSRSRSCSTNTWLRHAPSPLSPFFPCGSLVHGNSYTATLLPSRVFLPQVFYAAPENDFLPEPHPASSPPCGSHEALPLSNACPLPSFRVLGPASAGTPCPACHRKSEFEEYTSARWSAAAPAPSAPNGWPPARTSVITWPVAIRVTAGGMALEVLEVGLGGVELLSPSESDKGASLPSKSLPPHVPRWVSSLLRLKLQRPIRRLIEDEHRLLTRPTDRERSAPDRAVGSFGSARRPGPRPASDGSEGRRNSERF